MDTTRRDNLPELRAALAQLLANAEDDTEAYHVDDTSKKAAHLLGLALSELEAARRARSRHASVRVRLDKGTMLAYEEGLRAMEPLR